MKIFVTADEHYGHRNIIEYCNRRFRDTDHMREELIARHNEIVPRDNSSLTIHVGDMFWNSVTQAEALVIMDRLNGRHAFIYGNHDELIEKSPMLRERFDWIVGENKASGTKILHYKNEQIFLCHYALRVWNRSHKGAVMCFGHSHDELPVIGRSFDIGVDGNRFYPWSLDAIMTKGLALPYEGIKPENVWPGKTIGD